ncbi:hypothetical protein DNU06_08675 [Putridiphycobacter roseus]|uniref:Fibronectin type-III domain-containing protein n=1 Tax=Putridiphycobacter roseus TaxID=2219161 RepID=A0A2W1N0P0_9FLAO|nr:gliding motility-associated C-terminal domain-containing protein [Putridiphycobacter roseus]PZE17334.1 hypothetical protein DNU06_08675 [Putridiphycobacter roseus]
MKQLKFISIFTFLMLYNFCAWAMPMSTVSMPDRLQGVIVPPVDMTCVNVLANGDVTIDWLPSVVGTGTFLEYEVYCLESGPTPIATITNINTATYTHVGANGNLGIKNYVLATKSNDNGNIEITYSDTISSIFLEINDLGDGRVLVEWNPTHTPQLAGENINYTIFKEYPAGVWSPHKNINYGTFEYRDTIDICSAFVNYQVRVNHTSGCSSTSNVEGDFFIDIMNPYIPVVSSVTVDTLNDVTNVFWNVNQSSDTYGYIILKIINGFWENLDTIYGRYITSYVDLNAKHNLQSETYAVAAFDSCLINNIPPNYQTSAASESHATIYTSATVDLCNLKMAVNWTSYNGWTADDPLVEYQILLSINHAPAQVIKTVTPDIARFNYDYIDYNNTYCFFIRGVSQSGKITYSNELCKTILPAANPNFHYLSNVSHQLNGSMHVEWYTESLSSVKSFEIYKKGPNDFGFTYLTTELPNGSDFNEIYDFEIQTDGVYQYQVSLVDSCGNLGATTNMVSAIDLTIQSDEAKLVNTLSWTPYLQFDGGVKQYDIYRGMDGVYNPVPIGTTNPGIRSFVDELETQFDQSEGGFCYRIAAVEELNQYGFIKTAYSDEECMTFDPVIWVPNTIIPNSQISENRIFNPVISLYVFNSYTLKIFDRWGKTIFESDDIEVGWNGRFPDNNFVYEGVYVYLITFKDKADKLFENTGTVNVLFKE